MDADLDDAWTPGKSIRDAIVELSLSSELIVELPSVEAAEVRKSIEEKFLAPGYEWWWERLNSGISFWFSDPKWRGYIAIPYLCPDARCWFFPVYNDEGEVFRGRPTAIAKILEHTRDDEYALVDMNLDWLVIENHHNVLFGSGEPIASRLSEWLRRPGSNGETLHRDE
jgi:hypothetical protein